MASYFTITILDFTLVDYVNPYCIEFFFPGQVPILTLPERFSGNIYMSNVIAITVKSVYDNRRMQMG